MNTTNAFAATPYDAAYAEQYAERMSQVIDAGALSVMLSLGHRSGLLDVMATLPPSTSGQIAAAAALSERYVREWLAAMVTGRVVHYDPANRLYVLPAEHAASLTRKGELGNLAVYGQFVALMGEVQDRLLQNFESGAGTRYEDYPCFHRIMAEDSAQTVVGGLFDHVLPLIEGITPRLEAGIDVMDAGCGRGLALTALAQRFPESRFVGYDLCKDAIEFAQIHARQLGLGNIQFAVRDLSDFDETEQFDWITSFDAVHDQRDPQTLVNSLCRALRPNGIYLMQDIGGSAHLENNLDFPLATMLYAISCCHCMPVSLGQDGKGLGTMWGWETASTMLQESGFVEVERHVLPHDPTNVWFVARK